MFLNIFSLFVIGVIIALVVFLVVKIGPIPGHIASKRGHPQAEAIMVLGWIGIVTLGLAWPIALVWAYTRPQQGDLQGLTDRVGALEAELQQLKSRGTSS
jgi:hypothetical protein